MLSFDGNFDGYPGMSCNDEILIDEAVEQYDRDVPCAGGRNALTFLCFIASEAVQTREQYDKARNFIDAYVDVSWSCNMCEGSNPVQMQIDEET